MTGRSVLGATAASVEVDGVRLAFDASGTGRALVCLHAIGHGASDFARIRERLQGRFRVVAPDWPGQGNSAADHVAPSAERYAELLRRFLDAIGVNDAVLLGNSIGGAAALRFAAAHPARVAALVLLIAWAKRDRIIQLRRNLPAIRRFPNAKLETFEAGHAAFLETPDAFEASLERFLASLPPRPSRSTGEPR